MRSTQCVCHHSFCRSLPQLKTLCVRRKVIRAEGWHPLCRGGDGGGQHRRIDEKHTFVLAGDAAFHSVGV